MEILDTASSDENRIDFDAAEVVIVKTALKTKLFRRDEPKDVRVAKFKVMIDALATKFEVPQLEFVVLDNDMPGFGGFNPEGNKIVINTRFSLTTTLYCFACALYHHKPALQGTQEAPSHFTPGGFALSMFKQAAPRMFENAKNAGRLMGTNVPYTDGGRYPISSVSEGVDDDGDLDGGDDTVTDDNHPTPPPPSPSTPPATPRRPAPRADIDPENRRDRGNGLGED